MRKHLKKFPLVYNSARYAYRHCFLPLAYVKTLVTDSPSLETEFEWHQILKATQIDSSTALFRDRQREIKHFFGKSNGSLLAYFLKYGFPNTPRFKEHLIDFFEERTGSEAELKKAYEDSAFHYTLRLMLGYQRYTGITPYLTFVSSDLDKPLEQFSILDYGCGASDMGLLFSSLGAQVALADLDDRKFDFARWRFTQRGFNPTIFKITDPKVYPSLPQAEYDLIIATEVFEHVPNPLALLKNFATALKPGGFLFDSMAGKFERELGGDHLEQAIEIGNSDLYRQYYDAHFTHVVLKEGLDCLFRKTN
ncbi:MAG: class I SAM-dependent methyltransferase [Proteobacteria bacterium]|jgi:2-polyprenyl-3-methyl-5-hydroxy-6-metoxy-1,4-benzoquinol methylase|nr:class I SAM-dependent methyltransferase [Pseudomonadota bacterium]